MAGARPVADDTWLLLDESVLVTVARGPGATVRSRIAVLVSDHLAARGVPVTEPAPIPSGRAAPIVDGGVNDVATTFWQHTEPLPEPPGHVVDSLVDTVRAVHEVAGPLPVPLPRYRPLAMVTDVLARAGTSPEAALDGDGDPGSAARAMLALMVRRLQVRCQRLRGVLGDGLIHGRPDAGLRRWGDRLVLGDWRSACVGPREVDLVRLCRDARLTTSEVDKAMARYGWDVRGWGDYQTLCAVEDCRAVASLVGRSTASPVAAAELARRVDEIWATYRGCRW